MLITMDITLKMVLLVLSFYYRRSRYRQRYIAESVATMHWCIKSETKTIRNNKVHVLDHDKFLREINNVHTFIYTTTKEA